MRKMLTYIHDELLLFVAFTALLLTGCAGRDALVEEVLPQEEEFIELRLNIGVGNDHISRSPLGGENGDGREMGQHHENDVKSLLVFFYYATNGINTDADHPVWKMTYIPNVSAVESETQVKTEAGIHDPNCDPNCPYDRYVQTTIKLLPSQTNYYRYHPGDHYVVITNTENFDAATLGELRDKLVTQPWKGTGTNFTTYTDFVMSNEHESYYASGSGTKEDPNKIIVTIERVAARIDFAFDRDPAATTEANVDFGAGNVPVLRYPAYDTPKGGVKTKYGEVNLTHVRPFNVMQAKETPLQGSFLIKRSAKPDKSGLKFLAPEEAYDPNDPVADFPLIVEPTTWTKGSVDPAPTPGTWYGGTYRTNVNAAYAADANYAVHHASATPGEDGFNGGVSTDGDIKYYVLDYANENTMRVDESLKDFATGYILRAVYKPETVYKSTQSDVSLTDADKKTDFTAGTTFYRYRPLVTEFDESLPRYFTTQALAKKYGDHMLATTGVPYVIETFTNGVCYYPAYIRHDNAGGSPNVTPMEFGVVRNNIYRLKVTFSGPGYTTPEIQSTEPLGIKPYIYTRPWYKVVHEEITI